MTDSRCGMMTSLPGVRCIGNHVVGYMLSNISMPGNDDDIKQVLQKVMDVLDPERHVHVLEHIEQHANGDSGPSFELVLDLLIDGISAD